MVLARGPGGLAVLGRDAGETRACVRAMVVSEADFATTLEPLVMVTTAGVRDSARGTPAAEENAWHALAPAVAVAMMPAAERRDVWRGAQVRLLAAAWTRAAHSSRTSSSTASASSTSSRAATSRPTARSSTTTASRPDYSTNAYQNVDALLVATLAGHRAPEAALHGVREVYAALATNATRSRPGTRSRAAPSTTRRRAASTLTPFGVYYPQGCDWGEGQVLPYALLDAQAAAFGFGGPAGTPTDAADAAVRHLGEAVEMQERTADGRMYVDRRRVHLRRPRGAHGPARRPARADPRARGPGVSADAVAPAGVDVARRRGAARAAGAADESRLIDPAATAG